MDLNIFILIVIFCQVGQGNVMQLDPLDLTCSLTKQLVLNQGADQY